VIAVIGNDRSAQKLSACWGVVKLADSADNGKNLFYERTRESRTKE
jgi:hypothetical protein